MDFFSSLISAGGNLLGGLLNRNATASANATAQQNALFQDTHSIQERVADARAAGINPLAALGASTNAQPAIQVGDVGSSVAAAGQDVGRAANALTSQETKKAQLENDLLQAQIESTRADTVAKASLASSQAVRHSAPGTVSVPLPPPSPFTRGTLPLYQDYRDGRGGRVTMLSHDASQSVMNAASLPLVPVVGSGLVGENLHNAGDALIPSGARLRSLLNGWLPDVDPRGLQ